MEHYLINKEEIKDLCLVAIKEFQIYAPFKNFAGDVLFSRFNGEKERLKDLNLDYESLVIPPKVIAFPQLESLFEFKDKKIIETVKPKAKRILLGLRACDAKAILFLDEFFKRNFKDVYYLNRSEDKLLVIVGCMRPLENCFCTSTKTGPFLPCPSEHERRFSDLSEFDLQFVDLRDRYLVEIGSERGENFVRKYQKFFEQSTEEDVVRSETAKREAERLVKLKLDFDQAIKRFCEDKVPKDMYERIAQRCIYCGACLYVCPTCSCFSVFDEKSGNLGRRFRNWDTCIFEGYTREASGHNPRTEKWIRTSRRYEHKLKYDYLTTGISGCVGCGRCLSSCPVNIGISQVIEEISEDISYGE